MKIVLFGVGSGLKDVLSVLPEHLQIVCLSDNDPKKHNTNYLNYPIVSAKELSNINFDYIIITSKFVQEIRSNLIDLGLESSKILGFYSSFDARALTAVNKDVEQLKALGFSIPRVSLATMNLWPNASRNNQLFQDDFVRYMSINLVAERILKAGLTGNIAELGVYKGDLSVFLNSIFPHKKLYLFDTFEGFSDKDIKIESDNNFSVSSSADFSDTNLNSVLSRMPIQENVIPRKGYFPESANGVEDTFCFVSIDVDLYAPTIAGLKFFFPRLTPGGYIFVHDYNNMRYQGTKKAVDEFLKEQKTSCMPLPDSAGSIVILK